MNESAVRSLRFGITPVSGFMDLNNNFHASKEAAVRSEIDRLAAHLTKNYVNGNMSEGLLNHKDDLIQLFKEYDAEKGDAMAEAMENRPEATDYGSSEQWNDVEAEKYVSEEVTRRYGNDEVLDAHRFG